jgi:hypothetical protein
MPQTSGVHERVTLKKPSSANFLLWLLIAASAVGRLAVALADHRSLIANGVCREDAFYCLRIAKNVDAGRGFTFDGQTTTRGFQPAYQLAILDFTQLFGRCRQC